MSKQVDSSVSVEAKMPLPKWLIGCLIGFFASRLVLFLFAYRSFIDDTYIFMRYADNFAAGKGMVYNAGENVMGFTSPLYTYALGIVRFVTQSLPFEYVLLACSLATFTLLSILIYRASEKNHQWPALFTLFWLAYFSYVDASINGMETMLFCLLIFLSVKCLVEKKEGVAAMVATAAILTRPEGALLAFAMFAFVLYAGRLKHALKGLGAGLVILVAWLLYAKSVYGTFLPQSMLAKSAAVTSGLGDNRPSPLTVLTSLSFGIADDQITTLPRIAMLGMVAVSVLLSLLIAWHGWRLLKAKDPVALFPIFFFSACAFYVLGKSAHLWSWYTIPTSVCFMFAVTSAISAVVKERQIPKLQFGLATAAGLLCLGSLAIGLTKRIERFEILTRTHIELANYINEKYPNAQSVAIGDIGLIGYITKKRVVDIAMLVTPSASKVEPDGKLVSVASVAKEESPDVISLTGDPFKTPEIHLAQVTRPTFKSDEERRWFEENYQRADFQNAYHKAVFVRKAILNEIR